MALRTVQPIDFQRVLWTIVLDLLIIAGAITLSLKIIYLYPLAALIIAGRINALGIIAHDLCHQPLKNKSQLLKICEVLAAFPVNTTLEAMAYHHLNHHRHLNTDKDPYFEVRDHSSTLFTFKFTIIRGFLLPLGWFIRPFFGVVAYMVPQLRKAYAKTFLRSMEEKDFATDPQVEICARREWAILPFSMGMFLLALVNPMIIYFYFIPYFISGFFSISRLMAEHSYEELGQYSKHHILKTTFDNHFSFIDRIFISPHNASYHTAHHFYPTAPFYVLPELTKTLKEDYETAPV